MLWNDKRTPAGHVTDTHTGVTAPMGSSQHLSVQMGARYAAPGHMSGAGSQSKWDASPDHPAMQRMNVQEKKFDAAAGPDKTGNVKLVNRGVKPTSQRVSMKKAPIKKVSLAKPIQVRG